MPDKEPVRAAKFWRPRNFILRSMLRTPIEPVVHEESASTRDRGPFYSGGRGTARFDAGKELGGLDLPSNLSFALSRFPTFASTRVEILASPSLRQPFHSILRNELTVMCVEKMSRISPSLPSL